jgi:hypothetical protein
MVNGPLPKAARPDASARRQPPRLHADLPAIRALRPLPQI